jgi:hypothetical protein
VTRFVREKLPQHYDEIDRMFCARGAYRKYKAFVSRIGELDAWHDYENAATERAPRDRCAENGIEVKESGPRD